MLTVYTYEQTWHRLSTSWILLIIIFNGNQGCIWLPVFVFSVYSVFPNIKTNENICISKYNSSDSNSSKIEFLTSCSYQRQREDMGARWNNLAEMVLKITILVWPKQETIMHTPANPISFYKMGFPGFHYMPLWTGWPLLEYCLMTGKMIVIFDTVCFQSNYHYLKSTAIFWDAI